MSKTVALSRCENLTVFDTHTEKSHFIFEVIKWALKAKYLGTKAKNFLNRIKEK